MEFHNCVKSIFIAIIFSACTADSNLGSTAQWIAVDPLITHEIQVAYKKTTFASLTGLKHEQQNTKLDKYATSPIFSTFFISKSDENLIESGGYMFVGRGRRRRWYYPGLPWREHSNRDKCARIYELISWERMELIAVDRTWTSSYLSNSEYNDQLTVLIYVAL